MAMSVGESFVLFFFRSVNIALQYVILSFLLFVTQSGISLSLCIQYYELLVNVLYISQWLSCIMIGFRRSSICNHLFEKVGITPHHRWSRERQWLGREDVQQDSRFNVALVDITNSSGVFTICLLYEIRIHTIVIELISLVWNDPPSSRLMHRPIPVYPTSGCTNPPSSVVTCVTP